MSRTAINAAPKILAADIRRIVASSTPDRAGLRKIGRQLLQRHSVLRLEPVVSSEEVVEAYFRCAITERLAGKYRLAAAALRLA